MFATPTPSRFDGATFDLCELPAYQTLREGLYQRGIKHDEVKRHHFTAQAMMHNHAAPIPYLPIPYLPIPYLIVSPASERGLAETLNST